MLLEDVDEGFVFAVDVGHEVFRAFREAHDGLEVDDFGRGGGAVAEVPREDFEQPHVLAGLCDGVHGIFRLYVQVWFKIS